MNVVITPEAQDDLAEIWAWNAQQRGGLHADSYVHYLLTKIASLSTTYTRGRCVTCLPHLRFSLIRRRSKGHGHLAVYRVEGQQITVLHVFHSAQDWQAELSTVPE